MKENPFRPASEITARPQSAPAPTGTTTTTLGKPGNYGKGRFVVRVADAQTSSMGPYLRLTLGDRLGEANAISWRGANLLPQLSGGTVVEIAKFQVDERGPKFEPQDLRVLGPGEYRPDEFVASLSPDQLEKNWHELHEFLDSIHNPHLQALRKKIWGDSALADRYRLHPSAVRHHHNYLGGNVQHVVGMMRVVEAVCASYPELDRDLVIFGAAVHDLGKLREYAVGTTIYVTEEGKLKGHLVMGAEWVGQFVAELRSEGHEFPKSLEDDLAHLILSHHGKGEWGSPRPPSTPEAMLLHLADMADSQTKKFLQDVESNAASPEGWVRRFDADIGESRWIRTRREAAE